jgi:hypothetical protein
LISSPVPSPEHPGIPLGDLEGLEFVSRLDQVPQALDQSLVVEAAQIFW